MGICPECSGPVSPRYPTGSGVKIYCTDRCARKAQKKRATARRRVDSPPSICRWCSAQFISRNGRTYCYDSRCVGLQAELERKRSRDSAIKKYVPPKCKICGDDTTRGDWGYCSDTCREKATVRTCAWCGIKFKRQFSRATIGKLAYCSTAHSARANLERARMVTGQTSRGPDKDKRRARDALRRARLKSAFVENVYPSVVFERDNYRCHLCGKKCKQGLPGSHPDAATLDHVIPLSLGGPHSYANIATAHRRCNISKGVRAMNEQLALV